MASIKDQIEKIVSKKAKLANGRTIEQTLMEAVDYLYMCIQREIDDMYEKKGGIMGAIKHLTRLSDFTIEEIKEILERANRYASGEELPKLEGKVIANLFFEPSTRTQYSFADINLYFFILCIPYY